MNARSRLAAHLRAILPRFEKVWHFLVFEQFEQRVEHLSQLAAAPNVATKSVLFQAGVLYARLEVVREDNLLLDSSPDSYEMRLVNDVMDALTTYRHEED